MVSLDSSSVSITLSMWSITSSKYNERSSSSLSENFFTFFVISKTNFFNGVAILLNLLISRLSNAMLLATGFVSSNTLSSISSKFAIIFLEVCKRSSTNTSMISWSKNPDDFSNILFFLCSSEFDLQIFTNSTSGLRSPWWTVTRKSFPMNMDNWLFLEIPTFWESGGNWRITKKWSS